MIGATIDVIEEPWRQRQRVLVRLCAYGKPIAEIGGNLRSGACRWSQ